MTDAKKPPEGKPPFGSDQLSSLWQSALGQIDEIRDVIVRGSQAGKAKIDVQLLKRQKDRVLSQIGERVVDDAKRGAPSLPESCNDLKKRLDELEGQIAEAEREAEQALSRVK